MSFEVLDFESADSRPNSARLLKKSFSSGCSKMSRCKAPEILGVASRRIRSDFCHADESVSRPEAYLDVRRNDEG